MKISFLSLDQNKNKVYFVSDAIKEKNTFIFSDNSTTNVKMSLTIEEDEVYLQRQGDIEMFLHFKEGMIENATYKNTLGLAFDFKTRCTKLTISDKKILIWYDMLMEDCISSSFKIALNIIK